MLTRSFDYGAEMHILMKDIDLAIAQGEELGVPMWVCQAARLVFKHAMHKGAAKEDLTAIVKYIERDAGFETAEDPVASRSRATQSRLAGAHQRVTWASWRGPRSWRLHRPVRTPTAVRMRL